jgi:hypothetical protein
LDTIAAPHGLPHLHHDSRLGYHHPSLNTLLSITRAKKRVKKELGITAAMKPLRAWTNTKRQFKRKIGYESEAGRLVRKGVPRKVRYGMVIMVTTGRK